MEPYLPQNDPNPEARKRTLEARRKEYYFNYTYLPGYPFLDHVPKREWFSIYYWVRRLFSLTLLPLNVVLGTLLSASFHPVRHLHDFLNLFTLYRRPANRELAQRRGLCRTAHHRLQSSGDPPS
jgi:arachidonate 15-lipoxygenase